jgi:hypothetical protein
MFLETLLFNEWSGEANETGDWDESSLIPAAEFINLEYWRFAWSGGKKIGELYILAKGEPSKTVFLM